MHIIFSDLIHTLQQTISVQCYNMHSSGYISGIEFFPSRYDPERMTLDPDKAYVCDYRDLQFLEPTYALPPLICVVEPGVSADTVFFTRRTVAVITGRSMREVMLALSTLLYEYGRNNSDLTDISHELLHCKDMYDLLEVGYRALQNPLILTDSDQEVIAFTDPHTIDFPAYRDLISLNRMPSGQPSRDSHQSWADPIFHLPAADDAGLPPGLCMNLSVRSKVVGHLHLMAFNHPLGVNDLRILELMGNLLAIELWNLPHQQFPSQDSEKEHLLREILDNTAGDVSAVLAAQQRLRFHLAPHLYVMVVQFRGALPSSHASFYDLAKEMAARLPGAFGFLYRNSSFLLINSEQEIVDFPQYLTPIIPILEQNNLVGGISNSFPSLHQIRGAAFQCRRALQLGQRLHPDAMLCQYKDYSIYHMLSLCLQSEPLESFCSPELLRLSAHSQQNENELFDTLRVYLKCGRNKALTAREMFVHVSTIKYRMGQIQDIIGLDLDNDDNALKLMLSFKMLEYQEVFQHFEPTERFWQQ